LDKVVHFEIPADNVERASKFYHEAFGWGVTPVPELQYTLLMTTPVDENRMIKEPGSINGGMMQRTNDLKAPVLTISVENIDDTMKKIESLGGKIIINKMQVPGTGIIAYFRDPDGNVLGLLQPMMP
jgi:predicted enzyme related to lactoylglutathione lyase